MTPPNEGDRDVSVTLEEFSLASETIESTDALDTSSALMSAEAQSPSEKTKCFDLTVESEEEDSSARNIRRKTEVSRKEPECPVCLEAFDAVHKKLHVAQPCGHPICVSCAAKLDKPHKCPMCMRYFMSLQKVFI